MRGKQESKPAAAGAFAQLLNDLPPLLTMEQLCGLLAVNRRTVERRVAAGDIPALRLSKRAVRFRRDSIAAYLASLERSSN
jgi:excisionase family DNA binding protein